MMNAFATGGATGGVRRVDSPPAPGRDVLALVLAGLADGWRAWTRYRRLGAMDDAALARLGIARGDLARHAVLGTPSGKEWA